MKKRDFKEAMKPMTRKGCAVCSDCPKWMPSYCPITCATRIATHPACHYGSDLINSRNTALRAEKSRRNDA